MIWPPTRSSSSSRRARGVLFLSAKGDATRMRGCTLRQGMVSGHVGGKIGMQVGWRRMIRSGSAGDLGSNEAMLRASSRVLPPGPRRVHR